MKWSFSKPHPHICHMFEKPRMFSVECNWAVCIHRTKTTELFCVNNQTNDTGTGTLLSYHRWKIQLITVMFPWIKTWCAVLAQHVISEKISTNTRGKTQTKQYSLSQVHLKHLWVVFSHEVQQHAGRDSREDIVDADDAVRAGRAAVVNDGCITLNPDPASRLGQETVVLSGDLTFHQHCNTKRNTRQQMITGDGGRSCKMT